MASVYEARDLVTDCVLALKRLEPNADSVLQRRSIQLFEREFHQLAQLAHPCIVEVYDYAIDAAGPYYTMELLDGGDLHQLAPIEWQRACAIARDVCSALCLLHSRQVIHRDLSPRNVRCVADGHAKLIDFGAMSSFGPNQWVVGTPACCAPEIVALQALDARADLYALGATMYFMLTGRHAYPAHKFTHLAERWREPIVRPSQYAAEIPAALESLVLNLLRLDRDTRPGSATEVMHRLSAIDGRTLDESLLVAQAYLSTPLLVGRDKPLARTLARLKRATQGFSAAIAVEGASGVGRSRFLDVCVLEATLLGLKVVRTSADQAKPGDWGVVRSIAAELLELMPTTTLEAARPVLDVLGHALPELAARVPELTLQTIEPELLRPLLQHALREWLLRLCAQTPLLIAVDDMQRIDEPSATWLALLACELGQQPLVLIATIETPTPALSAHVCKLYTEQSLLLELRPLEVEDAERLLRSLFDDAPNVDVLAHRLWKLASGNPRQIMQLAQHMLAHDLVRYHGGAWSLPSAIDASLLAITASDAQRARVNGLSPHGRALASALAICPDLAFSPEEAAALSGFAADSGTEPPIDELLRVEIARGVRDHIALSHSTVGEILTAMLGPETRASAHRRLAEVLSARGDQPFRVAQHYMLAGQLDYGLDLLVEHARTSQEVTAKSERVFLEYVRSLPHDWLQVFHWGVELCEERKRPPRDRYELLSRLIGILAMYALDDRPRIAALLRELERHSGLADWAALDPTLEAMPRLTQALQQAQARYDHTPDAERVLDPLNAIKQLARGMIAAVSIAASSMDVEAVRAWPSLTPLAPLAPALGVIQLLIDGMCARYTGRFERAGECYRQILDRTAQPDRAGFDVSHSGFMRKGVMNGLGMVEAGMSKASCLENTAELEREPTHRVNSLQIRALYALWLGDGLEAERCKHSVDRVRIENSSRHWFEGSHLLWEIDAYTICDDVVHLKRAREELAPLVDRNPAWRAVDHYAAAHYHDSCGDPRRALIEVERALTLTAVGEHQSWTRIAALHCRLLLELGRADEALVLGERYLAEASAAELGYRCEYIRMALALVQVKLGRDADAISGADRAVAHLIAGGIHGINLGWAYETRARVALQLGDAEGFGPFSALTQEIYCAHRYPPLVAKFDTLMRDWLRMPGDGRSDIARVSHDASSATRVAAALDASRTPAARAALALSLLIEHSHARGGYLFSIERRRARCIARSGGDEPLRELTDLVSSYIEQELDDAADTKQSSVSDGSILTGAGGSGKVYRPVMLSHYAGGVLVINGVAVLDVGDAEFVYPAELATQVSKHAGVLDATTLATQ
jgi:tetratricopeptide (TPR) repeat protein